MTEPHARGDEGFDPDLFSAEELALMREAEGTVEGMTVEHDATELQAQYVALARMVAEGGERERQLRALVNDLKMLAATPAQRQAHLEQTHSLTNLVLASNEREVQLQQCLDAVRGVMLTRARDLIL